METGPVNTEKILIRARSCPVHFWKQKVVVYKGEAAKDSLQLSGQENQPLAQSKHQVRKGL